MPKRARSLTIEDAPLEELPELSLSRLGARVKPYKPVPTKEQWQALKPNAPLQSDYTQHRQQDIGRAIALGLDPANVLVSRVGNAWTFGGYINHRSGTGDEYKLYTVTWDGIGVPPAGVSTTTYSQGRTYARRDGTVGTLQGKPDKYTWAVHWLVNGIPPDSKWLPIPSRWSDYPYNALAPWVEYNLSL